MMDVVEMMAADYFSRVEDAKEEIRQGKDEEEVLEEYDLEEEDI